MPAYARAPLVALLSDFGLNDPYVGQMKGAVLSRCPTATLVDICHDVPPGDIRLGALHLLSSWPHFPADTVFLAVVDPGVGGARRAVAAEAGGYRFVGPDNGLLCPAVKAIGGASWVCLDRPEFHAAAISNTFHGRDLFAPVAAALATGRPLADLGSSLHDPVKLELPEPQPTDGGWTGEVLAIDRFGNAITNLTATQLPAATSGLMVFQVAGQLLTGPGSSYSDVLPGAATWLLGGQGFYEIAVRDGSAAEVLGLCVGGAVKVFPASDLL